MKHQLVLAIATLVWTSSVFAHMDPAAERAELEVLKQGAIKVLKSTPLTGDKNQLKIWETLDTLHSGKFAIEFNPDVANSLLSLLNRSRGSDFKRPKKASTKENVVDLSLRAKIARYYYLLFYDKGGHEKDIVAYLMMPSTRLFIEQSMLFDEDLDVRKFMAQIIQIIPIKLDDSTTRLLAEKYLPMLVRALRRPDSDLQNEVLVALDNLSPFLKGSSSRSVQVALDDLIQALAEKEELKKQGQETTTDLPGYSDSLKSALKNL